MLSEYHSAIQSCYEELPRFVRQSPWVLGVLLTFQRNQIADQMDEA